MEKDSVQEYIKQVQTLPKPHTHIFDVHSARHSEQYCSLSHTGFCHHHLAHMCLSSPTHTEWQASGMAKRYALVRQCDTIMDSLSAQIEDFTADLQIINAEIRVLQDNVRETFLHVPQSAALSCHIELCNLCFSIFLDLSHVSLNQSICLSIIFYTCHSL